MVHVFACDHTEEGVLLVCGESIDEERPCVPNLKIPPKPTGRRPHSQCPDEGGLCGC